MNSFLNNHYYKKSSDDEISHTRIKNTNLDITGGSYTIKGEDLETFHKYYYNAVIKKEKVEYLTEKQMENGMLCIDFDFRYDISVKTRQHTLENIEEYLDILLNVLKTLLVIENIEFEVYIFEKDNVNICEKENTTKDGIHILIGLNVINNLKIILREKFLSEIVNVSELPLLENCGWHKVYDEGICKGHTNWQMYGSCKPGNEEYKLKYILVMKLEDNTNEFDCKQLDVPKNKDMSYALFKKLSVQYKNHPTPSVSNLGEKLLNDMKPGVKKSKKKFKVMSNKRDISDILNIKDSNELDIILNTLFDSLDIKEYYIKEAHDYAMILPESYYGSGSYDKWIRLALALHSTDSRLFATWVKVSSKSKAFSFSDINDLYERWSHLSEVNKGELTLKSIRYWAHEEANIKDYEAVSKKSVDYYIDLSINPNISTITEYDIANVLYHLYKDIYLCVNVKNNIWYEFKNHKWQEIDSGNSLRMSMSVDIYQLYFNKLQEMTKNIQDDDEAYDELQTKKFKDKLKKVAEICNNLKKTQWKNNIMREAREIFYDISFLNKQDSKTHLLCFSNGVFDFENNEFRKGHYEDYITKSTNINYVPLEDCDDVIIEEINDFMKQLFPKEELREYMWEHLASTLIGTNENQTFNIYTGSGRNGKSKLVELMSLVLGDYKGSVPITLVTQGRRAIGSSSSEVVQLQGVRYAVMQEPSKGDKINEGIMKELTGGDPVQARALFKDSITFTPQFKLVVCTNTLFDIASNDEGTWRRIRVCDFMSKFKEQELLDEDPDEPYQFIVDKKLDKKFPQWKEVFISMLINIVLETKGIVNDRDIVLAKSNEYRSSQDYLSGYIQERIQITNDVSNHVTWSEVQEDFKDWFTELYGNKVPKGQELKEFLTKKFGKPQRVQDYNTNTSKQAWKKIILTSHNKIDNF